MEFHIIDTCECTSCTLIRQTPIEPPTQIQQIMLEPISAPKHAADSLLHYLKSIDYSKLPIDKQADKFGTIKTIKQQLKRLIKHHDYEIEKGLCDALGCRECSVERCVLGSDLLPCECTHCPFRAPEPKGDS